MGSGYAVVKRPDGGGGGRMDGATAGMDEMT